MNDGTHTYLYDAENRLIQVDAGATAIYTCDAPCASRMNLRDGDGRRVSKSNGKLYWYGAGGEILAETDALGNTTNEYIFFGGQRIATIPAGSTPLYYAEDFLGSSRVIAQSNGVVCYDADFTPFGGERPYTNTCPQNYKFEGKERDTETGNDDFGARYYSNRLGRWLSSDWSAVPVPVPYANLTNPQTLNLDSMVADDPESFADLDGHCGQQQGGDQVCPTIKVQAEVSQKPRIEQNQSVTLTNGQTVKATSVEGKITFTVKANGKPAADAKVTETNQNADTRNGQPVQSTLVEGKATTNANGQIQDKISVGKITDGTKDTNNAIKAEFSNNTWTSTDKQTLTVTLPGGCTCTATSTRTLTNAGSDGPSPKYKLTTTQPEVKPPN